MYGIKKSVLFKRQSAAFVADYRERSGVTVVNRFIDGLEHGIRFIVKNPKSCVVYTRIAGTEFRKWRVKGFPHSIYFRIEQEHVILEAIYAHKMDAIKRLPNEIE
jgi:plasmid stabilization system protein ParE